MSIIDIGKILGAVAAVVGTCFAIWNSKRSILRRIERKEGRVRQIDHALVLRYGLNRGYRPLTSLDAKRDKLVNQIEKLQRLI